MSDHESSATERERKYDVDDAAVLPRFENFDADQPMIFTLRADYFDTADSAILRHRAVLRKRTGGGDEGWHLKVDEGEFRREFQAPLADEPPGWLLDRVRAIIRDRPLRRIASVTTLREVTRLSDASGTTIAEVADDRVEASDAHSGILRMWREWEVELMAGASPDDAAANALLDRVESDLVAAGAVPSRFPSKLVRAMGNRAKPTPPPPRTALEIALQMIAAHLEMLLAADAAIRTGDQEGIHDMRTAIGRLRALLAALRRVLDASVTDNIRERLAVVVRVLEPARDAQVRREHATRLLDEDRRAHFPGHVRTRLVSEVARQEQTARSAVIAYLGTSAYFRLLDDLDALVARPPLGRHFAARPRGEMKKVVRKQLRRASKRLAAVNEQDLASVHDSRKAVRRARYVAEALTKPPVHLLGGKWIELASEATAVQDAAGNHRDAILFVQHLNSVARDATTNEENASFYGALAEAETQRSDELLSESREASARFRSHVAE
ncbi:MAG TPA: CYTH and CHAD domain-containing protein [Galbitalea sp.]